MDYPHDIYYDILSNSYTVLGSTYSNDGDVNGHHGWQDIWIFKLKNNLRSPEIIECKLAIYPNPAINFITIELKDCTSTLPIYLSIFNSLGGLIQKKSLFELKTIIELKSIINKGTYFYQISDSQGKILGISKVIQL